MLSMAIQRLNNKDFGVLKNPGVTSTQIVWGKNSPEARVTITRVTIEPGATQERHTHEAAEQIWLVEQGNGELLISNGSSEPLAEGDVVRTPPGDVHGLKNVGTTDLIYLSVTTPPQDYSGAYENTNDSAPVGI